MRNLVVIPGLGSDAAVWARTIDALGEKACVTVGDTLTDASLPAPAMSREIHGTIRRSELHLIPLCGHLPPIEKPAEMAKPLASLLENIA